LPAGLKTISTNVFRECESLQQIVLPDGLTSIGENAFMKCGLTQIILPAGLTRIYDTAFYSCKSLNSVTCLAATPPSLGSNVFLDVSSSLVIKVPAGSVDAYKNATNWKNYLDKIAAM